MIKLAYKRVLFIADLDENGLPTNIIICKKCKSQFTKQGYSRHKRGCRIKPYKFNRVVI